MATKRKNKIGYVYLLKSNNDKGSYKYGCTTLTPEKRCKRVNMEYKKKHNFDYDFMVIASFLSLDCYGSENEISWDLIPGGFGRFGEMFSIDGRHDTTISEEISSEDLLIKRFLKIGKVLV